MNLNTPLFRLLLADRKYTGELTVANQRKNTFTYEGERRIRLVTNRGTRDQVRARGNRLYVWGSRAGPGSIVHADVRAPAQQLRFERLRNPESFDLFVDRDVYLEGLVVRYRRLLRPRYYLRPFSCEP